MKIEIVRACIEDAPKLIEVQKKSFYEDFIKYGKCPVYNESLQAMEHHIKNEVVYKIQKDGQIIGDIIVRRNENHKYFLRVISIIPEFQNLGIGQMAMLYLEKDISDAVDWELVTSFKSYRNHHFYEKLGYSKIREYVESENLTMFVYKKIMPK